MLQNGTALPPLSATDLDGNSVDLGAMPGVGDGDKWTVVLFYRGHW